MPYVQAQARPRLVGNLPRGVDLLAELGDICQQQDIRLGRVEAIGALERARLAFYDQTAREYRFFEIDQPRELLALTGNVSLRDGEPMLHAHVTLGGPDGAAEGGHLAPGCVVFACEFVIEPLEGPALMREPDEATGLPLWRL